jgi:hypothetical protein
MYEIEEYKTLTDKELAARIKGADMWEPDYCNELIKRAGVFDETIEGDWEKAGSDNYNIDFEAVLARAADVLGVEIF